MRSIAPELIETLVRHFSHEAGPHFDPARQIGCQRESVHDLGFGWLYCALARILHARRVLVIGSGRGFSAACLGLGAEPLPDAEVLLVDPGYASWNVDGVQDRAAGFWESAAQAAEHFSRHLGLKNVKLWRVRSDEAFERLRAQQAAFDLILVDGEHSYRQALADFRNAMACLQPAGLLLAHDTHCHHWTGVALALEALRLEMPELETLTFPLYPGLSLIRKRVPPIRVRHVTAWENEQINAWRAAAGVNTRPLPSGDDPRPGVPTADPREGLYGIFENDNLIGGFGIRRRVFTADGPDNFLPDCGQPLTGPLLYGNVLAPEARGQRKMQLVKCEILRWFPDEGLYAISKSPPPQYELPFTARSVGQAGEYTAWHFQFPQPVPRRDNSLPFGAAANDLQLLSALQQDLSHREHESREHKQQLAALHAQLHHATATLQNLTASTSWRWTYPARLLGRWVRWQWRHVKAARKLRTRL